MTSDAKIAAYLIDHGARINIQNSYYYRWPEHSDQFMLQDIPVKDGASPLMYHMQVHMNPDASCSEEQAPLDEKAPEANSYVIADPETTRLLLERGADPNLRDNDGACALHHAHNRLEVELLLAHGADMTLRDSHGRTPLQTVLEERRYEAARSLLEHGADCRISDFDGKTALHLACSKQTVDLLLQHGADANARDNWGRTPLMGCDTQKICKALIEAGANPNAQDMFGNTALMLAWREDVLFCLLEHGAHLDARDFEGQSALHRHIKRDNPGCVAMLLAHGADVQARDVYGNTPLMTAVREAVRTRGHWSKNNTFYLLLSHGALLSGDELQRLLEEDHLDEQLLQELERCVREPKENRK